LDNGAGEQVGHFIKHEGSPHVRLNIKGLTLVELMIAMTVALVAFGLIYQAYRAQQRARTREQLVVDMQQNARSALAFMRRELRMAGYDPRAVDGIDNDSHDGVDDNGESAHTGFSTARHQRVRFTLDLNGDGDDNDANEDIEYRFDDADDANHDGIADAGAATLKRKSTDGGSFSNLAYDIVAVAFAYAFDDDGDGALDTYPGPPEGIVIWAYDSDPPGDDDLDRHLDTNKDGVIDASDAPGGGALSGVPGAPNNINLNRIRAVRVWLLARTRSPIPGYVDDETYVVGRHHITPNNGYKHCLLESMVFCRNAGGGDP
jgi:prepilin-type N-terminal cleavage/methylation domain-containing protein